MKLETLGDVNDLSPRCACRPTPAGSSFSSMLLASAADDDDDDSEEEGMVSRQPE
jgi:hypothetical protein